MDVLATDSPADAAVWIAERFTVPTIPARWHIARLQGQHRVGYERGVGLLIRSGLWAGFREATQAIAPVLLEFAEPAEGLRDVLTVRISYRAIARFSGISSHNAIRSALVALKEAGFLRLPQDSARRSPDRLSARYEITPYSDELWELAQAAARQQQQEITAEIELRERERKERIRTAKASSKRAVY
jgi:hypothetical protein